MKVLSEQRENAASGVETLKKMISLLATCIGLAVIVIGLNYAVDVFRLIFTLLHTPASLTDPIAQLATSFGGKAFDIKLTERTIPLANLIALLIYCFGVLLSALLTMALMQTGAKIVSLTAGDRHAVKQLLRSAFGCRARPNDDAAERKRTIRD